MAFSYTAILKHINLFQYGENQLNQPKDNFSMDWYYPVLTGVLEGDAAQKRLDEKWDTFVIDGFGCKCVREEPWVTVAETAELVMALVKAGRETKAKDR